NLTKKAGKQVKKATLPLTKQINTFGYK
ncbi:hypothetical protein M8J75_004510, partial [Diaphorina citri]